MNFDEMRTFVPAMCPNCSAHMKVDTSSKIARCESCGTECLVQDAIKTLNVNGTVHVGSATINLGVNTNSLLQRVEIMLADGDFSGATEKIETILDTEPTNAQAYIYKLMIALKVKHQDELANCEKPFDKNNFYQKALQFGDENTKAKLIGYLEQIKQRNENIRLAKIYDQAVKNMKSAITESDYLDVIDLFNSISDYKDSNERIKACQNKIAEVRAKEDAERIESEKLLKAIARRRRRIIAIGAPIAGALFVFVILLISVIIPNQNYKKAKSLLDAGDYEQAYALLEKLGKRDEINESIYTRAIAYADSGNYVESYKLLNGLDYKDSADKLKDIKPKYQRLLLSKAEAGSSVFWGSYEQDNNASNGKEDIEWIVLKKDGNKVLLISKYALDILKYSGSTTTSWDSCSLRRWLNETFLLDSFKISEQESIVVSTTSDEETLAYTTYSGNDTTDKVFLLSVNEVNRYFGQDPNMCKCKATAYCASKDTNNVSNGSCVWWLRTSHPYANYTNIANVDQNGNVNTDGNKSASEFAIRPAMWVSLLDIEQVTVNDIDKVVELIKAGDYIAAYNLLGELGYNDNIASLRYDKALDMIKSGDYESAYILIKGMNYKDSVEKLNEIRLEYQKSLLNKAQIGSTVAFGLYEQDNNTANGKESIEWLVLAKDGDKVLLISKYVLDCIDYHNKDQSITWNQCDLRNWLNKEFYNIAFGPEEQKSIVNTIVKADKNPSNKVSPGKDTNDKVFLLSMTEAKKYFDSDSSRICKATRYAYSKNKLFDFYQQCCWWLRTPGSNSHTVSVVRYEGGFPYYDAELETWFDWYAFDEESPCGVRPAMWISIK